MFLHIARKYCCALVTVAALTLSGFVAVPALAGGGIGEVAKVAGTVEGTPPQSSPRRLQAKDSVYFGELLKADQKARARVRFHDDTVLTLGDGARIRIDEMVYDPDAKSGNKAILTLLSGAFRYVSGSLSHTGDVKIHTPIATIGIRGTDFWGIQSDKSLSVVLLDDGVVTLTTKAGTVTLDRRATGVTITDPDAALPVPVPFSDEAIAKAARTVAFPDK